KSLVESCIGYRDLCEEFEDCSDNNSNEVNAAGTIVPTVRQNSSNNTNPFSADGPSNTTASPTQGKSSFIDASQPSDDSDMPELEDITYSDDENHVGAEADFNNLETSITVSPIPTTRIHKDHHVSQIISDLSSTTQTRSMTRMIKDQALGFEDPDHPDKVYKVVKALYGLHQAPKTWILETIVDKIMIRFGVNASLDFGFPLNCKKQTFISTSSIEAGYVAATSCCAQCKKQTFIATSSIEAGYVAATSCCAQVNDVTRLQALVDKKKVVVTEAAIREVLRLDDAEGVDCLPNNDIFTELNIIGRKFNFSKYIFDRLVRNVDRTTKFYMYPCFLQLLIRKQVGDLSTHTTKYALPTLTQKVFANMRRVGKEFSGVETPLFEGMLVGQEIKEEGNEDEHVEDVTAGDDAQGEYIVAHGEVPTVTQEPSIPSPTPTIPPSQPPQDIPSTSQVQQTPSQSPKRVDTSDDTVMDDGSNQGRMIDEMDKDDVVVLMDEKDEDKKVEEAKVDESAQVQGRQAESQAKIYKIDMDHASKVLSMQEDEPAEVQEVVDVVTTANHKIPAVTITVVPIKVAAAPSRRKKGVVIRDPKEESTTSSIISTETKSKDKGKGIMVEEPKPLKKKQQIEMDEKYTRKLHAEINKDIDCDVAIDHVKLRAIKIPAVQRYQVMKRKPQTEAQARKNMMMYLKNVAGFKLDYFKGMSYDDICPIFEVKFNSNIEFLLKTKGQMEEEENKALHSINETPA
nr:ribonuclease H-like domain-containing protein [Tanacetum cinerariifolium]